jgi:hypothetical protein
MSQSTEPVHAFDSCHRCGLKRRTRELEAEGIVIHLCDDCYWGREPVVSEDTKPAA